MSKTTIIILFITILAFSVGAYFYPQLPEKVASHWNAQGQVDGYMSKFWGIFLMPLVMVGLALLLVFIPKIDPLKENIAKFRKYFNGFVVVITLFFFYIYLLTILFNLGIRFNMTRLLIPVIGLLFYYMGILVENAKRNWFIGIRTPWTLSSDRVWDKTHKIGGKLFKIAGVVAFFGILLPSLAIYFILIPVLSVVVYTIVYSYFEYQKEINLQK